jgi:RNA recognition motif-containing protein
MSRRDGPDVDLNRVVSHKVSGLAENVTTADVKALFHPRFKSLLDVYLPMNLNKRAHRGFAFVRFRNKVDAAAAMEEFQGYKLKGEPITISICKQNSFFTLDTGYITNEALDNLPERASNFQPGMPDAHYETLRYQNRDLSRQATLKVGNLGEEEGHITDAMLRERFEPYGELASVYRPYNKGVFPMKPRSMAFVRFVDPEAADEAMDANHMEWLNGRQMHISLAVSHELFSQNESRDMSSAMDSIPWPREPTESTTLPAARPVLPWGYN